MPFAYSAGSQQRSCYKLDSKVFGSILFASEHTSLKGRHAARAWIYQNLGNFVVKKFLGSPIVRVGIFAGYKISQFSPIVFYL